jgi:type I restriction enzyme S subunit
MSKIIEKKFGDVCKFVRGPFGGSLKKEIFKPSGYVVYEQQHAINDQFDSIRYFIDEDKFDSMKRFELKPDDLIMSCSGTMGKIAVVPKGIAQGVINQALLKLTPCTDILPFYLKFWMESRDFQLKIEDLAQGAAIRNMASVKILKEIMVPIPSIDEQENIIKKVTKAKQELSIAKELLVEKISVLDELKESILHHVVTGTYK